MRPSPEVTQIISEKKALYCRYLDTQQWHLFDQVMLPDAKWKVLSADDALEKEGMSPSFTSKDAFVAHFSELFKTVQTIHVVGAPEMEQVSPDEIESIFASQWSSGPKGDASHPHLTGGGHYHELWKRTDGNWLMAECRFEPSYMYTRQ